MLSRVAENLFWIGRAMERAENVARLVDVARLMESLPLETGRPLSNEWGSVLIAAGAREAFGPDIERAEAGAAVNHLIFAPSNPSSVHSCLKAARENARAIRTSMTQESWEALNGAWAEIRGMRPDRAMGGGLGELIDWIKQQSALFRGAVEGTMLRDDSYEFVRMGMAIERVDSTARLIDVKYHVLLPSLGDVGSGADQYQWQSLLRAAAARRAYAYLTRSDVSARGVAAFLILSARFPRAILFNVRQARETVAALEAFYGQPAACHPLVAGFARSLEARSVDDIFAFGLHEFLTDVIARNYAVADSVAAAYGFRTILSEGGPGGDAEPQ